MEGSQVHRLLSRPGIYRVRDKCNMMGQHYADSTTSFQISLGANPGCSGSTALLCGYYLVWEKKKLLGLCAWLVHDQKGLNIFLSLANTCLMGVLLVMRESILHFREQFERQKVLPF